MTTEQNKAPPHHTPGPWYSACRQDGEIHETAIVGGPHVVLVHSAEWPTNTADIQLCTASPDMLSALKTTAGNLSSLIAAEHHNKVLMGPWLEMVDAAIAKATGST